MKLKIGSRKSPLALWQTNYIADLLRAAHPGIEIEIVTMDTIGDKIKDVPLPKIGAKGLFTQELEEQLLNDTIDLAVHSLKDLPSTLPEGLKYAGSPARASASDSFISTRWKSLNEVPENANIATGSQRRKAQLLSHKPFLQFQELRGSIDTRLPKLDDNGWDGIIMATAAIDRLQRTNVAHFELDPTVFVPSVAQGAIGIEIRIGRNDVEQLLTPILDAITCQAVEAERIFLRKLEGGCSVALGAYCVPPNTNGAGNDWTFYSWIGSSDGGEVLTESAQGPDPIRLANTMADEFLDSGARRILRS